MPSGRAVNFANFCFSFGIDSGIEPGKGAGIRWTRVSILPSRPASQLRVIRPPKVRRKRADEVYEYDIEFLKSELVAYTTGVGSEGRTPFSLWERVGERALRS